MPFRFDRKMLSSSKTIAALAWVERGAKIVALHGIEKSGACTCGRRNCRSPGKHPIADLFPRGHHSATRNPNKIRRAFKKYPNANLGIVLPPGMVVIDVDGPEGEKALKHFGLPETMTVLSGRGRHLFYKVSEPLPSKRISLPQIDIKDGKNGYLVGLTSTHKNGNKYRIERPRMGVAQLPTSFIKAIARDDNKKAPSKPETVFKAGNRNNELTRLAGLFRSFGFGEKAIASALQAINSGVCSPPLDEDEVQRIAASISKYEAGNEEAFGWLEDIEEAEPLFLLFPYIVTGALNVLDGNMGLGKSTFTCAIAAHVTTGDRLPFADNIEPGTVLIMSAEDDPSRVLKPRLMKAGADVSKIRFQQEPFTLDALGIERVRLELSSNNHALVIVDPIIAFMKAGSDGNNAVETMHFMVQLDQLAREFDTAFLIVRHLRKAKADHVMHQGIGSIAISARVRSGLILGRHPADPNKRAVAHSKTNYADFGPTIVFEMKSDGPRSHPKVVWHPCDPDITAEDILAAQDAQPGRPPKERDTAVAWLEKALRKGPINKKELDELAKAAGISLATLRRAGETLGVIKSKAGRQSVWCLP